MLKPIARRPLMALALCAAVMTVSAQPAVTLEALLSAPFPSEIAAAPNRGLRAKPDIAILLGGKRAEGSRQVGGWDDSVFVLLNGLSGRSFMLDALQGAGIAIAGLPFVADDLALGNLIMPFDHMIRQRDAYYFVCPEAWADSGKIAAFRSWLLEEAATAAKGVVQRP